VIVAAELLLLALAAACWPTLIVVVVVSLRSPAPARFMASFLAAGLLTTVTLGLVGIYALRQTTLISANKSHFGPVVGIAAGVLALLGAAYVRFRHSHEDPDVPRTGPTRVERMLSRGARMAFVAGVVLNIVPGPGPLVAMEQIAELGKSFLVTFAIVLGFYLIMFAIVEIPLIGYLVVPERTARATAGFNAWLDRNGYRIAVGALGVLGLYLVVRGAARLVF
jgi:hypothetical protein